MTAVLRLAAGVWRGLRHWSGDDAYDRYVRSHRCVHKPMARREFYRRYFDRRAERPRCC
jgi:uncharacterized short protein YbdD (DUF466 family)